MSRKNTLCVDSGFDYSEHATPVVHFAYCPDLYSCGCVGGTYSGDRKRCPSARSHHQLTHVMWDAFWHTIG
jgi:hypothetical protein